MDSIFRLNILAPQHNFFNDNVVYLKIQDSKGPLEVLPNYMRLVTLIKPPSAEFMGIDGGIKRAFISDGIMRIHSNTVTILCKTAEWTKDIDAEQP